ncbi:NAD(P)/FAD-dependent oxidoreductase [Acuticoccus sp. M5D2P5]|uniref:NAD(P)/FAD-dependent oxidoreductase n=1 Tax=Acuticoccus kalidii TaxID=2910977 RepID=UPI001F2FB9E1|nr:NAD(P)/FAD-dependent oxidoreductase [Acuticoccus kalidii]MCF3933176.1 NAD(P)/FAD-dependent oxidoreductase [Acuticoccus kalidii]
MIDQPGAPLRHRVVVVGGGFGGHAAVIGLAKAEVDVTLVDQRNHHIFQPLLYQAATASLAPSEIAWPLRHILRHQKNATTRLDTVIGVDVPAREVRLESGARLPYDTLVLATGARHAYFGHDEWEPFAPGLKTIEDATEIRGRILLAFEKAELASDPAERAAWLTFVVVGGGPTGVELAGTIAEMARDTLPAEFRFIETSRARVILAEAGPRILQGYDADLSAYAARSLETLGAEVILDSPVTHCDAEGVRLADRHLPARTVIWAAGVRASPAAGWLGVEADRAGRIAVAADLTVPGHPDIFAVGDTVTLSDSDGTPVPGIAPAAKQEGHYVAGLIKARLAGEPAPPPFRYRHAGSLAQIGRRSAIADFGRIKLRGAIAWWLWGIVHIYFLIGLPSRLRVALNWFWIHTRDLRLARLITGDPHEAIERARAETPEVEKRDAA